MTLLERLEPGVPADGAASLGPDAEPAGASAADGAEQRRDPPSVSPARLTVAGMLGSAAATWMMAGPFAGLLPKALGLLSVAVAGAVVLQSYRSTRARLYQLAAFPLPVVLASVVVAIDGGDPGRMLEFVVESLRQGGLSAPPVPFDPGWKVVLITLAAWLTVAASTIAVSFARPRLGLMVSGAVAAVGIMFQRPGDELLNVVVALLLTMAGMSVAYGAELARDGVSGRSFEGRRLLRSAGLGAAMVIVLIAVGRLGFLLPQAADDRVIPPRRPETPVAPRDRVLFAVTTPRPGVPLRAGVLDVYRDDAWMTPPYDPSRLVPLGADGESIADALDPGDVALGARPGRGEAYEMSITLHDVAGQVVPVPPQPSAVRGRLRGAAFEPRTQTVRVDGRQPEGTVYTVTAVAPPTGALLGEVPWTALQAPGAAEFLDVPDPGVVVEQLLAQARAEHEQPFEQLQYVRSYYYERVVAAGRGDPVDVPPARVEQMLQEAEASPYEIVAGEVLLARWLGVPARIGYGYLGGDERDGVVDVRPRHGAMWLEAYFGDLGWVTLAGRPPQAKRSLSDVQKNDDPSIKPTDEIAAQVFVPTLTTSISPVYVLVRYWFGRVLPMVLGIVALVAGYPLALKGIRRWKRRRWARARGPKARIAVAYAEIRDLANDLNVGHPSQTPIEFLDAVEPDAEHRELAWIVTRTMWGDMQRGVTDADAAATEETARSFRKRFAGGQPYLMRVLGAVSRESLRAPFDAEMPNAWWASQRERMRAPIGSWRLPRPRLRVLVPSATVALMLAGILVTGGVREIDLVSRGPDALPTVPAELHGYRFEPFDAGDVFASYGDRALVQGGSFFGIRREGVIVGTLEQATFKPGPRARAERLRNGVLSSLQMNLDHLTRLGGERVYVRRVPERVEYLWLARDLSAFQLMIATHEIGDADALFAAVLAVQRGESATTLARPVDARPLDPRRGSP